jgi:sigma-B regulation protein RsbU (phosphoserine phosphatase)
LKDETNEIEMIESTGPVLGPAPDQDYFMGSFNFKKNDSLLLYTDGIVEATNNKFEFYGEDRLKQVLIANKQLPARDIARNILEDVQKYSAKGKYSDDRTVVVIKRIK